MEDDCFTVMGFSIFGCLYYHSLCPISLFEAPLAFPFGYLWLDLRDRYGLFLLLLLLLLLLLSIIYHIEQGVLLGSGLEVLFVFRCCGIQRADIRMVARGFLSICLVWFGLVWSGLVWSA
jgi:hypothetical protein